MAPSLRQNTNNNTSPVPPLTIPPFSYGSNGFTVNDIRRIDATSLRAILFPQDGKRAEEHAQEPVTKKWLTAQLCHYGIGFPSSAKKGELQGLLERQIKDGQCDQVPSRILDIENKLSIEYDVKLAAHIVTLKRSRLNEFSGLETPSEQANFDINLFLSKYFLDENGTPDRSKTPEPLRLSGFTDRASLHEAASKISGLHTLRGGVDYSSRVLVIGWDREKVLQETARIYNEQAAEKEDERNEQWEKKMQRHHAYVARFKGVKGSKAFQAKDAVGSYIVECKGISEGWDNMDDLTMNIAQAGGPVELVADFDFGIIEGIMRLGFDRKVLSAPSESENDEEDDDENGGDDDEPTSFDTKRKRVVHLAKPQAKKKSKTSSAHPRRLYLHWRGRETGEGEIQLDYHNEHTGYLDFTDAGCTKFEGVIYIGYIGPNVPFRGFKVSGKGGEMTKSWSDYSEYAYEYARKARWR